MLKVSVEGQTTLELSLKLLELGRLLASEPVPVEVQRAPRPTTPRKGKPQSEDAAAPSASATTPSASDAPQASSSPAESKQPESVPAEQPPAPAPEAAPASDSQSVTTLEQVRALLSSKIKEGKQPAVNALVTSFAPALSKVPAEKLGELAKLAEAL